MRIRVQTWFVFDSSCDYSSFVVAVLHPVASQLPGKHWQGKIWGSRLRAEMLTVYALNLNPDVKEL